MRVLMDSCVWGPAAIELRQAGHDVDSVGEWGADPGDDEILRRAVESKRVLITLDKDFGELVFVMGRPHPGILRLVDVPARRQGSTVLKVLALHGADLEKGAIVVARADQLRVRCAIDDR